MSARAHATTSRLSVHGAAILLREGMLPRDDREAIIEATNDMVSDGLLRSKPRA